MTNSSYLQTLNNKFLNDTKGNNEITGKEILCTQNLNNEAEPYENAASVSRK